MNSISKENIIDWPPKNNEFTLELLSKVQKISESMGPRHFVIEKIGSSWRVEVEIELRKGRHGSWIDSIQASSDSLNCAIEKVLVEATLEKLK